MREIAVLSPTIEARYWTRVEKRGPDECWPWTGLTENFGHGSLFIGKDFNGNTICEKAHRLAWRFATGSDPGEHKVRHRCDNPPCQNPAHLELGTQADNVRDMYMRGRNRNPGRQGERHHAAKITEADVREMIQLRRAGLLQHEIADRFGVGRTAVTRILNGKRWGHVAP